MGKHWLNERFTEFVIELGRQKEAIRAGRWAYYADSPISPKNGSAGEKGPNPAWEAIAALLRRQATDSSRHGASGEELYREAEFAMAALADEVFLTELGNWPGRADWSAYPLQKAFFGTINAGEELFTKIDRFLENYHPGQRGLAEVYFNVLSLGFRGKYGVGEEGPRSLKIPRGVEKRRQRLLHTFHEPSAPLSSRVSDAAYRNIRTEEAGSEIPSARQSILFLALAVLVVGAGIWAASSWLRGDLQAAVDTLDRIEARRTASEPASSMETER